MQLVLILLQSTLFVLLLAIFYFWIWYFCCKATCFYSGIKRKWLLTRTIFKFVGVFLINLLLFPFSFRLLSGCWVCQSITGLSLWTQRPNSQTWTNWSLRTQTATPLLREVRPPESLSNHVKWGRSLSYWLFCHSEHSRTSDHARAPTKQNPLLQLFDSAHEVHADTQVNKSPALTLFFLLLIRFCLMVAVSAH